MNRRDFIRCLEAWRPGRSRRGAAAEDRMRQIGVLLPATADDLEFQTRVEAFLQGLRQLGWTIGLNVQIDTRWATSNAADIRRHAAEMAALAPDVILASGTSTVGPLLQATHTVPIVFRRCRRSGRRRLRRTAWRGRAATLLVSWRSNTVWAANGWNCSSRSRRA